MELLIGLVLVYLVYKYKTRRRYYDWQNDDLAWRKAWLDGVPSEEIFKEMNWS
jgi:hypothetical protein